MAYRTQGSAFHELVVLPTLAPHLARPYRVPGTDYLQLRVLSKFTRYFIITCHTACRFMDLFLAFIESDEPDTTETTIVGSAEPDLRGDQMSGPGRNPLAPATGGNMDSCTL